MQQNAGQDLPPTSLPQIPAALGCLLPCCRWAQHAAGLDLLPALPPGAGGAPEAVQRAAIQRYKDENRAAALLNRLVAAVQ